ncbi:putative bifunctional diguanylate cyclase/phosphodiesterase [Chitinimonas taiwanensis]|uniref:Diguanylate cyclase (GGDEF) domain-containing protein n=1 Tax=Chitinimonas taiwanensis DSM 18899 TaxID=1121279 RepID=A0A1K2H3Y3_9NEIS|nr:EAL domain-containing protein [Chitinimonas taiwanensis]SFZ70335.1 diguanylate cyclase (GGDEF) domain-containing protein [Chitinimonas taiwanensis DSM 18899]
MRNEFWQRSRQSLTLRIVVFFTALLALVLSAAFALVSAANLRISRDTVAHELDTGEKVFRRLLEQNASKLTQGAGVLASDFGLREAIGTGDTATLLSALRNHGNRIGAQIAMVSGLDNRLLADTLHPDRSGQAYPFAPLLAEAGQRGSASGIEVIDGRLYQILVVPVRAPITLAWITMGFEVDDPTAADLQALAGLQVSFLVQQRPGWQIYASTLGPAQRAALQTQLSALRAAGQLTLAQEVYATRRIQLGHSVKGPVYALLARSLDEAMAPFYALQGTLIILAGFALLVCLLVGIRLARRITGPLRALALVAQRIRAGDYRQDIAIHDGSEIGQLAGSLAHMQQAIAEREAEISKLAFQDSLTGLPNRLRFNQRLDEAILRAEQAQGQLSVLLIDLDRFQQINDTLGHPYGDRVLAEVGRRLAACARAEDTVARLSGDEFALLLPGMSTSAVLQNIGRIKRVFDQRFDLDGRPLDVRASIGVVGYPEHGDNAIELMRCADMAMYRAKRSGSGHALYDTGMRTFREEHLSLLGDLQQAVDNNELILYYQPKVAINGAGGDEAEALVRWIHPRKGFIPPGEFIPFAEQTGYIKELTRWVLARAIKQAGQWLREGRPVKVSVNLSTRDLLDPGLPATVASLIDLANLPPDYLCLEITESGFMDEPAKALDVLHKLRTLGLSLAIDDYGTGYSSLAYIRRLPITELKIDRAFVLELAHSQGDAQIVRSTIELGHRLGLKVVAEGVEDQPVVAVLAEMGCDRIQGYVFGKPMPAEAFDQWRNARLQLQ